MSVLFTSISKDNPVTTQTVRDTFSKIGVAPKEADEEDYVKLLAACHDVATTVENLPDYEPEIDLKRFPRKNVYRVSPQEQVLGAWAHTFSIKNEQIRGPLSGKTTPTSDATVVAWALEAGAEIVGIANCENWCQSTSSFSSSHGIVDNPHALGYSAGGSTSGAAALVGARLVDIAIRVDQGGSIRVPAALCGCVGLKPTHGLVPYSGIASNDAVNDHAGPLASSVLDVALCLDAISGYDGIDDRSIETPAHGSTTFASDLIEPNSPDLAGFKVGILVDSFDQPIINEGYKKIVLEAAQRFSDLGATVGEVSVPDFALGNSIWTIQQRIAGTQTLLSPSGRRGQGMTALEKAKLPWTQEKFDKCFATTRNVFLNGLYLMENFPSVYAKTMNLTRRLRDSFEKVFEEFDVLVTSTTGFVAPRHGRISTPIETIAPTVGLTTNTAMFDVTGQPAISIPIGWQYSEDGKVQLPVGMQIISGLWKDGKVLKAAHARESKNNWRENKPQS